MFVELCTSHDGFDMDVLMQALVNARELCNVIPLQSVVKDAKTDVCRIEHGAKVTLFDTTEDGLLDLWFSMRKTLHVHCVWIDIADIDYHGCICNWSYYEAFAERTGKARLCCSEY